MTTTQETGERIARPMASGPDGPEYLVQLTKTSRTDPVFLQYEPAHVLPVVFVPGIMGSNLRDKSNEREAVWRLDNSPVGPPVGLLINKMGENAAKRQKVLHPARTQVDGRGAVPKKSHGSVDNPKIYTERGWGEVGEGSYHAFLCLLEDTLNGPRKGNGGPTVGQQYEALQKKSPPGGERDAPWRPIKDAPPPTEEEIKRTGDWFMPVYACGYNWLDDNSVSAERLAARIREIIKRHHDGVNSFCQQVIVVTHSMGGLVARACAKLPDMDTLIAGVVHGVMPTNGAAVAYRRCKVGMADEDWLTSWVIGHSGKETTAVFAQAPGALQLLPTQHYTPGWLEVRGPDGNTVEQAMPQQSPYSEIYARRDRWWALVKEEWLSPKDGQPIKWKDYLQDYLKKAIDFHQALSPRTDYHPNTYVFYGADTADETIKKTKINSFERIVWRMKEGIPPPQQGEHPRPPAQTPPPGTPQEVFSMTPQQVDLRGLTPERVKGEGYGAGFWELHAGGHDGTGDGTVPASSGRAPADCDRVQQVFRISGVEHEGAYRHATAQQVTVYSLIKIAAQALPIKAATRETVQ
ncbi:hypothetical protein WKW80_06285 [Variovorax humicola]|uniref:GPI inositol-deacylase PGAP1-like alpha/beta domain-containing protein n=1 Tax=Variovorax humicola TaxID=1769758 RepID=A0ABU8VWP1_9BURK